MLAKVVAVVRKENDDCVVSELESVKRVEQFADAGVHQRNRRIVGLNDFPALGQGQLALVHPVGERGGRDVVAVAGLLHHGIDLVERIQVGVVRRGDVRGVRPEEAHRQKERLASFVRVVFLDQPYRLERALAVGVILVAALDDAPTQRATIFSLLQRGDRLELGAVDADWVGYGVPRCRIVLAVGADLKRHAVVINLADAGGEVAVVHEMLRQSSNAWVAFAEVTGVGEHAGLLWIQAGHERGTAWIANGVLAVGAVKTHAAPGQAVDVRRLDERVAVAAKVVVEVVHGDKKDIRLGLGPEARIGQAENSEHSRVK